MVWGSVSQSQMVGLDEYPHLLSETFERPTPALSLFRHFHFAQVVFHPGGRFSSGQIFIAGECGRLASLSFHIAMRASDGGTSSGVTLVKKLFLDFRRLGAGA